MALPSLEWDGGLGGSRPIGCMFNFPIKKVRGKYTKPHLWFSRKIWNPFEVLSVTPNLPMVLFCV
jgi:hypothetical protein